MKTSRTPRRVAGRVIRTISTLGMGIAVCMISTSCRDATHDTTPTAPTDIPAAASPETTTPEIPPSAASTQPVKKKLPRPAIAQPKAPVTAEELAAVMGSIERFLGPLGTQDYAALYEQHLHSAAHAKTDQPRFQAKLQEGLGEAMQILCTEILDAYRAGGIEKKLISATREGSVPDSVAIKLVGRPMKADPGPGQAVRILLAPDPTEWKFYDVD